MAQNVKVEAQNGPRTVSLVVLLKNWEQPGESTDVAANCPKQANSKWVALDQIPAPPVSARDSQKKAIMDSYFEGGNLEFKGGFVFNINGKVWGLNGTITDKFHNVHAWVDAVSAILCDSEKAVVDGTIKLSMVNKRVAIQKEGSTEPATLINLHSFMNLFLHCINWSHRFTSDLAHYVEIEAQKEAINENKNEERHAKLLEIAHNYGILSSLLMESFAKLDALWLVFPSTMPIRRGFGQQQQQQPLQQQQQPLQPAAPQQLVVRRIDKAPEGQAAPQAQEIVMMVTPGTTTPTQDATQLMATSQTSTTPSPVITTTTTPVSVSVAPTTTTTRTTPAAASAPWSIPTDYLTQLQQQKQADSAPIPVAGVEKWPSLNKQGGKRRK